jgi:hypothetical protein
MGRGRWEGGGIERKKERRKIQEKKKECFSTRFGVIPVLLHEF